MVANTMLQHRAHRGSRTKPKFLFLNNNSFLQAGLSIWKLKQHLAISKSSRFIIVRLLVDAKFLGLCNDLLLHIEGK